MNSVENIKFMESLEKKVRKTIREYSLIRSGQKVGVAVSGGKDSTVCLYILKKLGYNIEGITIDAAIGNYTKENLENLKGVCQKYEIPLRVISFRDEFGMSLCFMRSLLKNKGFNFSSCMLCGILKRYLLNKYSREFGYDILATGHNLDDGAQAFIMNVFRNDLPLSKRYGPSSIVSNSSKFVQRIKPLYLIPEDDIIRYSKIMEFPVNYGICPCSVKAFRRNFINFIDDFEKLNPSVKFNIIRFHENMKKSLPKEEGHPNFCSTCGEPCSKGICKVCQIFDAINSKSKTLEK